MGGLGHDATLQVMTRLLFRSSVILGQLEILQPSIFQSPLWPRVAHPIRDPIADRIVTSGVQGYEVRYEEPIGRWVNFLVAPAAETV